MDEVSSHGIGSGVYATVRVSVAGSGPVDDSANGPDTLIDRGALRLSQFVACERPDILQRPQQITPPIRKR